MFSREAFVQRTMSMNLHQLFQNPDAVSVSSLFMCVLHFDQTNVADFDLQRIFGEVHGAV